MKIVIAGTRWDKDLDREFQKYVYNIISILIETNELTPTEIVSGCCRYSPDYVGELYAQSHSITISKFPPDWEAHKKAAGPIRNREMVVHCDAVVLIWDGKSAGSSNMKKEAQKLGKPVYDFIY